MLFISMFLLFVSSCDNSVTEDSIEESFIPKEEIMIKEYVYLQQSNTILANGLREDGVKLPNAYKQDYQLSYSKELEVFSKDDAFYITTLYPGNYFFIQTDPLGDTLLNIDIIATKDQETAHILEVIERKDKHEVMNTKRASWFYTSHFMLNKKMPNFKASVFEHGATFEKDFDEILDKSKVSMVFIWEYGCPACKEAIEELKNISKEEANQLFNLYTIFYEEIKIDKGKAKFPNKFIQLTRRSQKERVTYHDFPLNYGHILFNASELTDVLNYRGYPTAFIVDGEGVIRSVIGGYIPNYKEIVLDQVHMVSQLKDVPYKE